ncbi:unnamed protein product, partial [Laminaria digitata]
KLQYVPYQKVGILKVYGNAWFVVSFATALQTMYYVVGCGKHVGPLRVGTVSRRTRGCSDVNPFTLHCTETHTRLCFHVIFPQTGSAVQKGLTGAIWGEAVLEMRASRLLK